MTKEELAEILNGREYREEITEEEELQAKENGLIVIFGASDDLVEFRGVIYDELDAYDGIHFIVAPPGTELPVDEDEETYRKSKNYEAVCIEEDSETKANRFEAVWSPEEPDCSWVIKTDMPHAWFNIIADGELYCIGVVIDIKDLSNDF